MAKKNFSISTVATAPSPATTGTSLVVEAGHGSRFAQDEPAIIFPDGEQPDSTNAEIVTITNIATDTLTITREQESTSARTVVVGDVIIQGITADDWNTLRGLITENADGFQIQGGATERTLTIAGADVDINGSGTNTYTFPASTDTLVGRTSTDTLTNKTIDGDDNTLQDIAYSSIKSTSRTGSDTKLVTGTEGSENDLAIWNTDGDVVGISGGWIPAIGSYSIGSDADGLDYISVAQGMIDVLSEGMRIKVDQDATTYYGIIHDVDDTNDKIGVFLSVESNTRNRLNGNTISNLYWSREKFPHDFPANPNSWRFQETSTNNDGTSSTSYVRVLTSFSLTVPLGAWKIGWSGSWGVRNSSGTSRYGSIAMSNSTTSVLTDKLRAFTWTSGATGDLRQYMTEHMETDLDLTEEETFYLIAAADGSQVLPLGQTGSAICLYAIDGYL